VVDSDVQEEAAMTDQTDDFRAEPDEFRGETAEGDVEGHSKIRKDADEARLQTDEGDDDVEGHMKLNEPKL
jgi:hypothetical protein